MAVSEAWGLGPETDRPGARREARRRRAREGWRRPGALRGCDGGAGWGAAEVLRRAHEDADRAERERGQHYRLLLIITDGQARSRREPRRSSGVWIAVCGGVPERLRGAVPCAAFATMALLPFVAPPLPSPVSA